MVDLFEGEVVPFRRPRAPAAEPSAPRPPRPAGGDIDFELRYVRDPQSTDWQYGINHAEDPRTALISMQHRLRKNPQADQGLDGVRYVDFVPQTARAREWLATQQMIEIPRLYGKLAIIELIHRLRHAGFVLQKTFA